MGLIRNTIWLTSLLTGIFTLALGVGLVSEAGAGVFFNNANLPPESDPPNCNSLVSFYTGTGIHPAYPGPIQMRNPRYKCFQNVYRQAIGMDEQETFDCMWECDIDLGSGPMPVTLTGIGTHMVYGRLYSTSGLFDCEIVSLDVSGIAGGYHFQLRESPYLQSPGMTDIQDVGGGLYEIDSFFDVYTELSIDGGPWMPQTTQAARIILVEVASVLHQPTSWGAIKALYK
jgi:hypothetical protein